LQPRFVANGCPLVTCADCGYVEVAHVPPDDELADIYRDAYFEKPKYVDDAAARHEFERRTGLLRANGLTEAWRVLDYGCASGDFVAGMGHFCEMWGVDYSPEAIAKAASRHAGIADRFTTIDAMDQNARFDAVTLWDVIEHVPSPPETLALVNSVLAEGGILVLSTPNIGAATARMMGKRWAFMTPPEHLGFFNRKSMEAILQASGFAIVDWSSRGKLVNIAFLVHKAGRVFPKLVPRWLGRSVAGSRLGRACVYVPTGDIQYIVCRKVRGIRE
jgi:2-polyprenyl-3-methyl-5-hydroxy-6-metoxy-1,4-benzoquinol methylase